MGGNFQLIEMKLPPLLLFLTMTSLAGVARGQDPGGQGPDGQDPDASAGAPAAKAETYKVATVDIQELFKYHQKTINAEREINAARADIQKNNQAASNELQRREINLKKLDAAVKSGKLSQEDESRARREAPFLYRELKKLEENKARAQSSANEKLNLQMMLRMRGILEEITSLTKKYAEDEGYDLVIDESGKNSSQVSPILFIKGAVDITPEMKIKLSNFAAESR